MEIIKLEKSQAKVVFDVTPEEFEAALDKAFTIKNAKVTIKGFRAGKAPRHVYEKNYGVESLFEEALNVVLNAKAEEVYKNEELAKTIVGKFEPEIESENGINRGEAFKISLTFDVYPEVNLPQYKGIEAKAMNTEVSKEEITKAIESLMAKDANMEVKAEQVIEKGDYAVFDFLGTVDGVPFDGGKAENYELQIGSGQFIPGFEDQMLGMKAGESKDVNVTFPEQYTPELAGKDAVFAVTVHEVKVNKLPELTDEYVAALNIEGVSTVQELEAKKEAELKAQKEVSEKNRVTDEIVNKILDNAVVDMPQTLIDERVNAIRAQYENQAKMYNIPFETFLGLMNMPKEVFEEETAKQGARQALFNVIAEKVIEVENLVPTKEQLEAKAEEEAARTGQKKEELLRRNVRVYYNDLAYNALIDLFVSNAKLV